MPGRALLSPCSSTASRGAQIPTEISDPAELLALHTLSYPGLISSTILVSNFDETAQPMQAQMKM